MRLFPRLLPVVALLALAGCNLPQPQADTTRHFTLSGSFAPQTTGANVPIVRLAGHLRSRTMAVRLSPNEVAYLEDIRWAEPLDEAITRIVRTRVGAAGAGRTVAVLVTHCEADRSQGNQLVFTASIDVAAGGADAPAIHADFVAPAKPWDGKDYAGLVGQMQQAAVELGDAVAAALAAKP